jgi:hypothetical protein
MATRKIPDHFLTPIVGESMFGDPDRPDIFLFGDPKRPRVSRPELKRFIRGLPNMLGWGEEEYRAALVMLAPFVICSRDARAVSRYTGVPLPVVKRYYERLSDQGIWRPDGSVQGHWVDPELGMKVFWRDVLIATGKVGRVKREVVVMPPGEGLQ